jgi:midasin
MQICFIISDARVDADNRESLSNLISQLADRHIICVLLIIDKNKILKDSILETKIIEFTESGIISRAYLDNFPFPYFAVIQNLEMLPNILSETLKQWFETIKLYFSN